MKSRDARPAQSTGYSGWAVGAILGISLLVHVTSLLLGSTVLAGWRCAHYPLHAALEMAGAIIAVGVAHLLLVLQRRREGTSFNVPIAAALVGMGVLDGLHALVHAGNAFVFLHSLATFVGGLLFATLWLPRRWLDNLSNWWPWSVTIVSLVLGVVPMLREDWLPVMVQDGSFTAAAMFLNVAGGVLMMAAAGRLVMTYRQTRKVDDILFCLHCALFGAAAIMFEHSALWDFAWWGWHVLRLMAYGVALYFLILSDDRAMRRAVENARRERLMRASMDTAHETLLTLNPNGLCVDFNQAACEHLQYSGKELRNMSLWQIDDQLSEADWDSFRKRSGDPEGCVFQTEFRTRAARLIPVEVAAVPVTFEGDQHICLFVQDLTERRANELRLQQATRAAEQASQAKSEFLASMSHELRTPLNGVLGMTDLLARTDLSDHQQRLIRACQTSGESLLELINQILDFSKIEAGMLELDLHDFVLESLIRETVDALKWRAEEKGLQLSCYVDPLLKSPVTGDSSRLRQILINLTGNAIKFTDTGEISVGVQVVHRAENDCTIRLSVSDTGIGIPEDRRHCLFETFSQVDSSTARRFGGTGLGLSICKSLVELMGGRIDVESTEGVGSTFWCEVTLPFSTETLETPNTNADKKLIPTDHTVSGASVPESSSRVLLVEDNEINRMYLIELLKHFGITGSIAVNGEEAVAAVQKESFDLVLMDCQMPGMDGLEATAIIRQLEASGVLSGHLSIVALTANALKGDQERCLQAGMDDYLSKPVEPARLEELLNDMLSSGDSHRAVDSPEGAELASYASVALVEPGSTSPVPREESTVPLAIDVDALVRRCIGEMQFIEELLDDFETRGQADVDEIRRQWQKQNYGEVAEAAHALKGVVGILCADSLFQLSSDLELAARSDRTEDAGQLVDALSSEMSHCLSALPEIRKELLTCSGSLA